MDRKDNICMIGCMMKNVECTAYVAVVVSVDNELVGWIVAVGISHKSLFGALTKVFEEQNSNKLLWEARKQR